MFIHPSTGTTGVRILPTVEFTEPRLERQDNLELRARILHLTPDEAMKAGIGKSSLHYLRKKARLMPVVKQLGIKSEPQVEIYPTHAIFTPAYNPK